MNSYFLSSCLLATRQAIPFNLCIIAMLTLLMLGCAANEQAPVIDRAPSSKKAAAKPVAKQASPANQASQQKDWRPDSYTVKKGDTLYSIGLQYGYDYKEIAQQNNIAAPYTIFLGQQLRLKENAADAKTSNKAAQAGNDDDVVTTPLKTDGSTAPATIASAPAEPPLLTEPKAIREPYSDQAYAAKLVPAKAIDPKAADPKQATNAKTPEATKAADIAKTGDMPKPAEMPKPADSSKQADSKPMDDEAIAWAWPTPGNVITTFNEQSSAKGIDIAGSIGQPIKAAAAGKVIYSGSDLRGYGKLVIIKHNKTYLSVYAHNSQIVVKEGQAVSAGQKVAEMGNTDADSVKLHFEIRQQGKSVDPAKYLPISQ